MRWFNTHDQWGWITIVVHWLTVFTVLGLFGLGLWMLELDYYDAWYNKGPSLHKSIGMLLLALTLARLVWRQTGIHPAPLPDHKPIERFLATSSHYLLYLLLISVMLSGYLISTADGRAIEVFNWFRIPATLHGIDNQEDIAGIVHLWLAVILIGLVVLHAMAALKHHFFDHDRTLKRMLGL